MSRIVIIEADLSNSDHAAAILNILNSYAKDSMGMGEPLDSKVKDRLIKEMQQFPCTLCLLAFIGDKPAGLANCFYGFSTFKAQKLLNIHDLAVNPDFRGRGVGNALLESIETKARENDCCKITLEVREDNRARRLYERKGFTYGDPTMYFMTRELH